MTRTTRSFLAVVMFCLTGFGAADAWAKREPPADVPPVVSGNVRYEAALFMTPCDPNQNGGCVVAYDNTSNAQLWAVKVYCTKYDSYLEQDVQDVFITSLALSSTSQLQVSNEAGKHFTIDPTTQKVSGDTTGCSGRSSSGCSYAPSSSQTSWLVVCGLVLLLDVMRMRFARSQR